MKRVLIIVTSHSELLNTTAKTGLWLGEFTDPYYEFIDAGFGVTVASPFGGAPPIDPVSRLTEHLTASNRRFSSDKAAQQLLKTTKMLADVNTSDFDALFIPGGHGPMFDLANNFRSAQMIINCIKAGKPVAAVCHGPAAFIKAAELDPSLLKGVKITGFSNAEEKLSFKSDNIPFLLEDKLTELGGQFEAALLPFASHDVRDGLIITGQNPLSAGPAAKMLVRLLEGKISMGA